MLLQLFRRSASTKITSFDFAKLTDGLANNGFKGAIHEIRRRAADLFGVPVSAAPTPDTRIFGELFMPGGRRMIYLTIQVRTADAAVAAADPFADPGQFDSEGVASFDVGAVAPLGEGDPAELDHFCEGVNAIVEAAFGADGLSWKAAGLADAARKKIKGKPAPAPAPADLELAAVLREPKLAPFLAVLGEKRGEVILDEWLGQRSDADEIEYFIDKLYEADLFDEEIVVYSQHNGQPVIRAKDRAGLEALKSAGIRDVNGDELDIENVRRLLILPKDKRAYLGAGWTARVVLLDALFKLGVAPDDLIELPAVRGLTPLIVVFDGEPLIVILGDQAVDANDFADLAPAVSLFTKPLVVTLAKGDTDTDAAEAAGAGECLALKGIDDLNTVLLDRLARNRHATIAAALQPFNNLLNLNLGDMALARFSGD